MNGYERLLALLDEPVRTIVDALDQKIRELDPAVERVVWQRQRTIGYGIGPRKMTDHYAYVDIHESHVNLGFNHGAALADPCRRLLGSGQRFRHLRIASTEDIDRETQQLLRRARAERVGART